MRYGSLNYQIRHVFTSWHGVDFRPLCFPKLAHVEKLCFLEVLTALCNREPTFIKRKWDFHLWLCNLSTSTHNNFSSSVPHSLKLSKEMLNAMKYLSFVNSETDRYSLAIFFYWTGRVVTKVWELPKYAGYRVYAILFIACLHIDIAIAFRLLISTGSAVENGSKNMMCKRVSHSLYTVENKL